MYSLAFVPKLYIYFQGRLASVRVVTMELSFGRLTVATDARMLEVATAIAALKSYGSRQGYHRMTEAI
jgi:hypothetical protein